MVVEELSPGEVRRSLARLESGVGDLGKRVRRLEVVLAIVVSGGTLAGSAIGSWLGGGG